MTTEKTQTADGGAPAPAGGSAAGAADLDTLLKEFEGGKPKAPAPGIPDDLKPVIEFARTEMTSRAEKAIQEDVSAAIKFVKEDDGLKDLPDKVVRGMLEVHAGENPAFKQAFENRLKDPASWKAKLAEARTAVAGELKPLVAGTRVHSDIAAARAAVSGQSRNPEVESKYDPAELVRLPERDWQTLVEKELARSAR